VSGETIGDRERCDALFEGGADFVRVHRPAVAQYSGERDDPGIWKVDAPRGLLLVEPRRSLRETTQILLMRHAAGENRIPPSGSFAAERG
jgi:hypothetical protein